MYIVILTIINMLVVNKSIYVVTIARKHLALTSMHR